MENLLAGVERCEIKARAKKSRRKKRGKKWAISNKKLARFGKIVLLFGIIESELNKILVAKLKLPEETKDTFIASMHMGEKMRILRKLAGRDAELFALLRMIGDVNIRRNRIMHAHWRGPENPAPNCDALHREGSLHHQQQALDTKEMKATVKALGEVVGRLERYCARGEFPDTEKIPKKGK